jgi:hypothetical protein
MNRRFLFLLLLLSPFSGAAQKFPFEFWHEGKMILESGDTLKGMLKYNMQDDLVQFQASSKLETYSARKILFFEIFDTVGKRYRQFYSLPYAVTGQYKAPVFFELLEEGKMTLLAREALEVRSYSSFYYYGAYTRIVLVNKFFLLKENGSIQEFSGKKNDLIELMGKKEDQIHKFIKENRVDFDNKYDVARVVAYYNSLFK